MAVTELMGSISKLTQPVVVGNDSVDVFYAFDTYPEDLVRQRFTCDGLGETLADVQYQAEHFQAEMTGLLISGEIRTASQIRNMAEIAARWPDV